MQPDFLRTSLNSLGLWQTGKFFQIKAFALELLTMQECEAAEMAHAGTNTTHWSSLRAEFDTVDLLYYADGVLFLPARSPPFVLIPLPYWTWMLENPQR